MDIEVVYAANNKTIQQENKDVKDVSCNFQSNQSPADKRISSVGETTPVQDFKNDEHEKEETKQLQQEWMNPQFESPLKLLIWNFLYVLIILVISILWSTPATLIPVHNAILFPSYWWETILSGSIPNALYLAGYTIVEWKIIYNMPYLDTSKN